MLRHRIDRGDYDRPGPKPTRWVTMNEVNPTREIVHLRKEFPTPLQRALYDTADELFLYRQRSKGGAQRLRKVQEMLDRAIQLADHDSGSRTCPGCGQLFTPPRNDALYCSSRCRQRVFRRAKASRSG